MARRKFFILDYTLSDDYIHNLLCQVVGNKYDPKPSLSDEPLVQEHFPDILPKPNITANRKECFENATSLAAKLKLSRLFHLDVDRSQEERTKLESELVKRYSLAGGSSKFKKLMEDPRYEAQVREVLISKRSRRAYFVEGFMTTTNATWSKTAAGSASSGAGVTVTGGGGGPGAAGLEAAADATHSSRAGNTNEWVGPGEEIFAVSYLEVKLEGKGFLGTGPKDPVIGDVVVASNKTAALSPGSHDRNAGEVEDEEDAESDSESTSSESEEEDDDEDGEVVLSAEEWGVVEGLDSYLEVDVTFE